eukprot:1137869-Pelagomonas_calceolata.AAC.1
MSDSRKYTSAFPQDAYRSREQHYFKNGHHFHGVCGKEVRGHVCIIQEGLALQPFPFSAFRVGLQSLPANKGILAATKRDQQVEQSNHLAKEQNLM